jgi:hypothetical protein
MKKTGIFVFSAIILAIANMACNNQKTIQEYLREEKKAIDRYIAREGIIVLKEYPEDSTFQEKEYYRTSDGLYMHVSNRGSDVRVKPLVDQVQVRFEYFYYVKDYVSGDTARIVMPFSLLPQEFIYGQSGSYGKHTYDYSCNGWAIPLGYVGEGAVVDLIIPSALGASFDNYYPNYNPIFYKNLIYTNFY